MENNLSWNFSKGKSNLCREKSVGKLLCKEEGGGSRAEQASSKEGSRGRGPDVRRQLPEAPPSAARSGVQPLAVEAGGEGPAPPSPGEQPGVSWPWRRALSSFRARCWEPIPGSHRAREQVKH